MSVTDGDRERAADWIESVLDNWMGAFDHSNDEVRDRAYVLTELAAALAEEREKARAPFLALAEHYAADEPKLSTETMRIFRDVARDIRRVAEVTE